MEKSALIMLMAALTLLILPAHAQLGPQPQACTPAMINSVGPCMSFLTDSSANVTSPTQDCCNSLRSLTAGGSGCLCLIVTGSIPFRVPINRTTAVSLPQACNMPRVPVQCKANIAPAAAPGPASLGPMLSPTPSPSPAGGVPGPASSAQSPESGNPPVVIPSSPTAAGGAPTSDGGSSRPSSTPSAAFRSSNLSPSVLLFALSLLTLKFY